MTGVHVLGVVACNWRDVMRDNSSLNRLHAFKIVVMVNGVNGHAIANAAMTNHFPFNLFNLILLRKLLLCFNFSF